MPSEVLKPKAKELAQAITLRHRAQSNLLSLVECNAPEAAIDEAAGNYVLAEARIAELTRPAVEDYVREKRRNSP
jgi:hypothetical protein